VKKNGNGIPPTEGSPEVKNLDEILAAKQGIFADVYEVIGEVARGGMGKVLEVFEKPIGRTVAMKVALDDGEEALERFKFEGRITGQLDHPNIVTIYDIGFDVEGNPYYTMEFIHGQSLSDVLEHEEEADLPSLLLSFIKICDAVAFAHSKSVINRDLKPANVMIGEFGKVLVVDWGLAKKLGTRDEMGGKLEDHLKELRAEKAGGVTVDGAVLGTPQYMPPEQAKGEIERIDERSDIYSLGAILYEILTGEKPIEVKPGDNAWNIAHKVIRGKIIEPHERTGRKVPLELSAIVMKAMAPEPEDRYRTVEDLSKDIRLFLEGRTVSAKRDSIPLRFYKLLKRNRAFSIGMASALLALAVGVILMSAKTAGERRENFRKMIGDAVEAYGLAKNIDFREGKGARDAYFESALSALNAVNQALETYRRDERALKLKREIALGIGEAACECRDYSFARYIYSEAQRAGMSEEEVADLKEEVERARTKKIKEDLRTLRGLMDRAGKEDLKRGEPDDIVFDIVRMPGAHTVKELMRILKKSDAILPEGEVFGKRARNWVAEIAVESLGRLGDSTTKGIDGKDAVEILCGFLERINTGRQMDLAVKITDALGNLGDGRAEKTVYRARLRSGQDTQFWKRTELSYQKIPLLLRKDREQATIEELLTLGHALGNKGERKRAIEVLGRVIALDPRRIRAYLLRGSIRDHLGDHDKAIEDYNKMIELDPECAEAFQNRGAAYSAKGDSARAVKDYGEAIRLNPKDGMPYFNRGNAYYYLGLYDKALADYAKAMALIPGNAAHYNMRGVLYQTRGEFDKAIADFTEAIRLNPLEEGPHNNRGVIYKNRGEYDKAIADFNVEIRQNPSNAHGYANRGFAYAGKRDFSRAILDYNEAIRLDPEMYEPFCNRADAYRERGEFEKSLQDADMAIRLNPQSPIAFNMRGRTLIAMREYDRAIEDFRQALRIDPRFYHALANIGLVLRSQGRYDEALEYIRKSLALAGPGDKGRIENWLWETEEMRKGQGKQPKTALDWVNKAAHEKLAKKFDEAIRSFEKAVSIIDAQPPSWQNAAMKLTATYGIGRCHQAELRWTKAGRAYEQSLSVGNEILANCGEKVRKVILNIVEQSAIRGARSWAKATEEKLEDPGICKKKAVAMLRGGFELGFKELNLIKVDSDFDPLRDLPEYKKLIEEWREKESR
jgi:tetratricopeptide (TPR) repeat protein